MQLYPGGIKQDMVMCGRRGGGRTSLSVALDGVGVLALGKTRMLVLNAGPLSEKGYYWQSYSRSA